MWDCGRTAPGRHAYGGWYHFVETLDEIGDAPPAVELGPDFTVVMIGPAHAPRLHSLKGKQVVQLEFYADAVPWRLDEPEID